MKTHRLFCLALVVSLILIARGHAADGTYQRTDDRKKTFVWNNDPQPGDTAEWSGQRDAEGYATGPGTLTWSRINKGFSTGSNLFTTRKKTPISAYTGTMEHGKFNGGVTTVDHGKTYHAQFVDGQRKGNWVKGPLVAKAESAEPAPAVEKPKPVEPAKSTAVASPTPALQKVVEEKKPAPTTEETTTDIPAAGPTEEKTEIATSKTEVSKSTATEEEKPAAAQKTSQPATPLIAQATTEESATPRQQPVNKKTALAPGTVRSVDRPTTAAPKKIESEPVKKSIPVAAAEEKIEKPTKSAKATPVQARETKVDEEEESPAEGPESVAKKEIPPPPTLHTATKEPAAKEKSSDKSLQTLTGPPSSLNPKATPLPETNPPTEIPTAPPGAAEQPAAASPPPQQATAKLTAVQAMDIADIEARTRGYDLGEYQLPKAEYNGATDTWSVGYAGRNADGTSKKFNVIVQDKTGKAEVKK